MARANVDFVESELYQAVEALGAARFDFDSGLAEIITAVMDAGYASWPSRSTTRFRVSAFGAATEDVGGGEFRLRERPEQLPVTLIPVIRNLPECRRDPARAYSYGLVCETMGLMAPHVNVTANVLLIIGYPLALGVLARLRSVLAERRVWWAVILEAATASITAGWLLHGRPLPAALNAAALLGFAITWLITAQRVGPPARKPVDRDG